MNNDSFYFPPGGHQVNESYCPGQPVQYANEATQSALHDWESIKNSFQPYVKAITLQRSRWESWGQDGRELVRRQALKLFHTHRGSRNVDYILDLRNIDAIHLGNPEEFAHDPQSPLIWIEHGGRPMAAISSAWSSLQRQQASNTRETMSLSNSMHNEQNPQTPAQVQGNTQAGLDPLGNVIRVPQAQQVQGNVQGQSTWQQPGMALYDSHWQPVEMTHQGQVAPLSRVLPATQELPTLEGNPSAKRAPSSMIDPRLFKTPRLSENATRAITAEVERGEGADQSNKRFSSEGFAQNEDRDRGPPGD
ncbi:hypothetical protein GGS23DRAFT_613635 [Durotheca rogersii]|uniref:uncharacterized protein n=1 Tax=Durotheca rogersii TaxID=419775 RepID=UPI00221FA1F3|nr:uncharacterized protein GGS23DRAFT_613635 [Durotheca rogersii]KAI5860735.1 hypothetical protein GGS23DRAFT_613635 [Durotheca rogersii]